MKNGDRIERVSTVDAVVKAVMQLALSGELPAGAPLRENDLAERFGVGRHSVRAALQVAARDGLAVYQPNRGVFIREFTARDIEDIYTLRDALEIEAVRLIHKRRLPRRQVDVALDQLKRQRPDRTLDEAVLADLEVHRAIVAEVDSPRMQQAFDSVMLELRLALAQAGVEFEDPEQVLREHEQLVARIWSSKLTEAVAAVRDNNAKSVADLKAAMGLEDDDEDA